MQYVVLIYPNATTETVDKVVGPFDSLEAAEQYCDKLSDDNQIIEVLYKPE